MHIVKTIKRLNPSDVPAPVGNYSHVTIIPKNAQLYTFSGQIGIDSSGYIPNSFNEQVILTFKNILLNLESQLLSPDDVTKVNIWATQSIDWDFFDLEWEKLFGSTFPSMTVAYITALGLPALKLEIEITAAKVLDS